MSNDKTKTERQKIESARRKKKQTHWFLLLDKYSFTFFLKSKKSVTKKNKKQFGMVVFYLQHQQHKFV